MLASAHTLRASALLIGCVALLSSTFGRVLPVVKRSNTTCCGYNLVNRGNTRFRYEHVIDFSSLKSIEDVTRAGWEISDGWQICSANGKTGQVGWASETTVRLVRGEGLTLTVPGGQSPTAKHFLGAEIVFPYLALGGYWEVEAKLTNVPGAVAGIYTSHGDPWDKPLGWKDEQAIKVGSSTLMKGNQYVSAGMHMANVHPDTGVTFRADSPFPADPSQAFHKYSISWLPESTCPAVDQPGASTKYRHDGNLLNLPTGGYSTHPSRFIITHFTNADPTFSAGPPAHDAVITIKKVRAYFNKPNKLGNGACPTRGGFDCSIQEACPVTVS
ncbi:hypothetical protein QFC21_003265 [Naganishia friedmannii]|uniref:Uncharacterized protein n=1 Tax=Naganishia friedmannii TaxID=89922 RepID=A0ACC2VP27_9TREE|nr:hypothetical protein QFC21_003265 [Naganishia friedmannii]